MKEFGKRQFLRRKAYSWPVLVILLIFTILSVKGSFGLMAKKSGSIEEVEILNQKKVELEEREIFLIKELESLNTEAGLEREIKSKFNVARAGEQVALITETKIEPTTTPQKLPWWKKWWGGIISR